MAMKALQRKVAYVFCGLRILVDLLGLVAVLIFAVTYLMRNVSLEVNIITIISMGAALFLLGADIHMVVTRDIRHIMGKDKAAEHEKSRGMP